VKSLDILQGCSTVGFLEGGGMGTSFEWISVCGGCCGHALPT
jgi:hypothetical protein